jgi:peptidyl-dipeptidase Dcp
MRTLHCLVACAVTLAGSAIDSRAATPPATANPFFQPSDLPYHLPPFDRIHDSDFMPAFTRGMEEQRKEIDAIAHEAAAADVREHDRRPRALGALLTRVSKTFTNLSASNADEAIEKIEAEVSPKLSAHRDAIFLDPALFARVDALYQKRAQLGLDDQSAQLLERYEKTFLRAGAKLAEADKERLKKINEELSSLSTKFRQNTLQSTKDDAIVVDDVKQLAGLSPEQVSAAAEAAKARGLTGKWVLALQNTRTSRRSRSSRTARCASDYWRRRASAGSGEGGQPRRGAAHPGAAGEKAKLLGYPSFAAYALAEETAETPAAVDRILGSSGRRRSPRRRRRRPRSSNASTPTRRPRTRSRSRSSPGTGRSTRQGAGGGVRLRRQRGEALLRARRVLRDGVFFAANKLYGITFSERKDLPVYHPDVRVFEVHEPTASRSAHPARLLQARHQAGRRVDGHLRRPVGPAEREAGDHQQPQHPEAGGRAARPAHLRRGERDVPRVRPPAARAVLEREVPAHRQHQRAGRLRRVPVAIQRDVGPRPAGAGQHRQALPDGSADAEGAARQGAGGDQVRRGLRHARVPRGGDARPRLARGAASKLPRRRRGAFEQSALAADHVLYAAVPPRYHTTYFSHIFSNGYEAGYYAYIWSEVLARDAGAWMMAHGGLSPPAGDVFRAKILSRGRTEEPSALFRELYGRDPEIGPLLEYRAWRCRPARSTEPGENETGPLGDPVALLARGEHRARFDERDGYGRSTPPRRRRWPPAGCR